MTRRPTAVLASICCLVAVTACSSADEPGGTAPSTAAATTPELEQPPTSVAASTSIPATTPVADASSPPTVGTTAVAPTVAPVSEEVSGALDVLAASVFGIPVFVERPSDDVVHVVSDRLGVPTSDTGFVQVDDGLCFADSAARTVRWGDFRMTFLQRTAAPEDGADPAVGTETLLAWAVGSEDAELLVPTDEAHADPVATGFTTGEGIGVGSTRDDLRAAYPADRTLGVDDDRVTVRGNDGVNPTGFTLDGDTVVGIGNGPLNCAPPDEER
ncbi:MAG: hypothetical protein WBP59_04950 [Ilumatobacteraceae bacterium]